MSGLHIEIGPSPDSWLEHVMLASQILAVTIAAIAAMAALRQISAFKLFEMLKFIQEEKFRTARRVVIAEIGPKANTDWWTDHRLEEAASTCCGHYDIVGIILQYNGGVQLTRHFVKNWAVSIIRTYDILSGFMERRRAHGGNEYRSYEWLYRRALRYRASVGAAWPIPPSSDPVATPDAPLQAQTTP